MNDTTTPHVEQLAQHVEKLTETVEQQAERIEELESELSDYRAQNERDKAMIRKSVTEVEEEIEEANADPSDPVEGAPDDPPLFSVIKTPDEQLSATKRRTKHLFQNLTDYTSKTPSGRVITNPDLTKVLRAAEPDEGAQIGSELAKRVLDESEALTRGAVTVEKVDKRWRMVIPPNWKDQARAAYYDDHAEPQNAEGEPARSEANQDRLTSHSVVSR